VSADARLVRNRIALTNNSWVFSMARSLRQLEWAKYTGILLTAMRPGK
jgi:hypothetical protein